MKYNTKLNFWDYAGVVNSISDGFFDSDYNYVPHIGKINAMRIFYNYCVEDDINGISHDVDGIEEMLEVVKDEAFIDGFDKALICHGNDFDFANAFKDAIRLVDTKRQSWERILSVIGESVGKIIAAIRESVPDELVDKMSQLDTETLAKMLAGVASGTTKSGG